MGEVTSIEWADSSLNFWLGCQETGSEACRGCYARALVEGRFKLAKWGPHEKRVETKNWRAQLRKISRLALAAFAAGRTEPWFVFVNSLSDFWDNQANPQLRAEAFAAFREHPHLTFLLLTKRPQNIVRQFAEVMRITADEHGPYADCWPRNVAIGCTVATQAEADRDILHLLRAKAALRPAFAFLSIEPMAEAIRLWSDNGVEGKDYLTGAWYELDDPAQYAGSGGGGRADGVGEKIDWVITGGGTDQIGWKAPPMHPAWPLQIAAHCERAGTAYLHKQNGEYLDLDHLGDRWNALPNRTRQDQVFVDGKAMIRVGKKAAGRALNGRTYDARPEVRR